MEPERNSRPLVKRCYIEMSVLRHIWRSLISLAPLVVLTDSASRRRLPLSVPLTRIAAEDACAPDGPAGALATVPSVNIVDQINRLIDESPSKGGCALSAEWASFHYLWLSSAKPGPLKVAANIQPFFLSISCLPRSVDVGTSEQPVLGRARGLDTGAVGPHRTPHLPRSKP